MTEDVVRAREEPEAVEEPTGEPDREEAANAPGAADSLATEAIEGTPPEESSEVDSLAQLQEELAAAQALAAEYLDLLQRTTAEFQNSRRRQETRLADAIDRANGDLIRRLIPILDDFDLALQNAPDIAQVDEGETGKAAEQGWVTGFRQIHKKLLDLLQEQGVTPVEAAGEFDPSRHEAISSEPSEDFESGHIIEVLRSGYEYKGQVLRPAMVRVAA